MEASRRGQKSVAVGPDERIIPLDALRVTPGDLGVSRMSQIDQSLVEKLLEIRRSEYRGWSRS